MNQISKFFGALFTPKSFNDSSQRDRGVQTERAIFWLTALIVFGFAVIGLRALAVPSAGLQFFSIGIFAAIGALGAGAVLGLLFSLPVSNQQIVVVASGTTGPDKSADPVKTRAAVRDSGYGDNSSLQQIGSWLTSVIVAVTLTQFTALSNQFTVLASEISAAMSNECSMTETPVDVTATNTTVTTASPTTTAPPAAARAPAGQPATTRQNITTLPPKAPAKTVTRVAACASAVPGGSIVATYAILGFLLCYLWGRRYLATELASASSDARVAADNAEQAGLNRASQDGLTQATPSPPKSSAIPIPEISPSAAALAPTFPPQRAAGLDPEDPWKGAFGGTSANSIAELVASVEAVSSIPGQFLIDLRLRGIAPIQRDTLKGQPARIYLHPTFSNPVRDVIFDGNGEVRLTLSAYGAFTVGAQLRDDTVLELNLVNVANAPAEFKAR